MLNAIKNLLRSAASPSSTELPEDEGQLLASAAAMLLFEVAWADHEMGADEITLIEESLQNLFDLSAATTEWLVTDARAKHEASVGLYEYTRTINEVLEADEKFELMVSLWRLAHSDKKLHALEEHAIRRISELLYVPHAQFIKAKQQAQRAP